MKNLLGVKVLPLVRRKYMSASYASSVLHGANDMHRSCHMDSDRVSNMVERAMKKLREDNKNQHWEVSAIRSNGNFDITSEYGYTQGNVDRSDFRVIKSKKK